MKTELEDPALYHAVENNTLLNDVFFYVLHHLPQLQNMHEYIVPARADTDPRVMEAFVQRKYPQIPGPPLVPPVQFFSRNLLAYLETLVAFSPYGRVGRAADPAGRRWIDGLPDLLLLLLSAGPCGPAWRRRADGLPAALSQPLCTVSCGPRQSRPGGDSRPGRTAAGAQIIRLSTTSDTATKLG